MVDIGNRTLFATGPTGTSGLDSLTVGGNSLWAQYGNGAKSDGTGGSSTLVQDALSGAVQNTYTIAGLDDGLKIDPATGTVFVLQNQDGNSPLMLIDPATGKITGSLSYAVPSTTRGYDDVVFENGQLYLSYTNPNGSGDAVIQRLDNGDMPFGTLSTSDILLEGATGTDISTGLAGQPIPLSDRDSLKSTPDGGLVLSSGSDNTLTFISHPGAANQSERFVTLKNLPAGSSLDDVVVPGSTAGTFYISNQGTNQIEAIKVSGLNTSDAYASVGTEIVKVDLQTGATTAIVTGLSKSHGLTFVPDAVDVPVVQSIQILAVGSEVGGTKPDSITLAGDNVFVEYGNGADATGKPNGGSSTIVEYDKLGRTLQTYSLPGSLDGLKYNPVTGQVWALQNQDANSSRFIIDPTTQQVSTAFSYDSGYVYGGASTHGYDDVAFTDGKVYLSYTNPAAGDPVIELLDDGNSPRRHAEDDGDPAFRRHRDEPHDRPGEPAVAGQRPRLAESAAGWLADPDQRQGRELHHRLPPRHRPAKRQLRHTAGGHFGPRRRDHPDDDVRHVPGREPECRRRAEGRGNRAEHAGHLRVDRQRERRGADRSQDWRSRADHHRAEFSAWPGIHPIWQRQRHGCGSRRCHQPGPAIPPGLASLTLRPRRKAGRRCPATMSRQHCRRCSSPLTMA